MNPTLIHRLIRVHDYQSHGTRGKAFKKKSILWVKIWPHMEWHYQKWSFVNLLQKPYPIIPYGISGVQTRVVRWFRRHHKRWGKQLPTWTRKIAPVLEAILQFSNRCTHWIVVRFYFILPPKACCPIRSQRSSLLCWLHFVNSLEMERIAFLLLRIDYKRLGHQISEQNI